MQFLLNPDGSVPPGTDIAALKRLGIPLVMPVRAPSAPGMVAIERPSALVDGVLTQQWDLVPAPEPEPVAIEMPVLNPAQFAFLLAATGYDDLWSGIEAKAKAVDLQAFATLRGLRARDSFRWDETLRLIGQFAEFLPEGAVIDPEALADYWLRAAAF